MSVADRGPIDRDSALALRGGLFIATGAGLWGLFWIPLRHLDALGIGGLWSIALVSGTALLPAFALAARRGELAELAVADTWRVGVALGLAAVLYFAGVLLSDVVRVVFLFYLLPLWTTLAARLIYGEPILPRQLLVIAAALVGLWLLLGGGTRLPLPRNVGDWCALAAGLCWGVSLALLREREATMRPFAATVASLVAACALAVVLALPLAAVTPDTETSLPGLGALGRALPLAIAFGAGVLYPALLGQIWGARLVAAPTAALLTMTEIVVATLSAWWLVGTDLGPVSLLGGLVIVVAVLLDVSLQWRSRR